MPSPTSARRRWTRSSVTDLPGRLESVSPDTFIDGTSDDVPATPAVVLAVNAALSDQADGAERPSGVATERLLTRGIRAARWIALCLVIVAWCGLGAHAAFAAVGEEGAFLTSVSIKVPAFHGIEPGVGLSYDSGRPDGVVGVGWRL